MSAALRKLEVSLLGVVAVRDARGTSLPLGLAGPTLELFAYLLTFHHRPARRDHLADLFWESLDVERSRAALNTALWRVRRATGKLPGLQLTSDASTVQLGISDTVSLDIGRLKASMTVALDGFNAQTGLTSDVRLDLAATLGDCDGDFLEGAHSTWVLVEREECINLRLRGLTMLMQDAGLADRYEDALAYGRRILAVDPFREAVQCEMLWLYMLSGRRAMAIRHYRAYEVLLKRELGIVPMAETRAIHDAICAETDPQETLVMFGARPAHPAADEAPRQRLGRIEHDRRSFYRSHFIASA